MYFHINDFTLYYEKYGNKDQVILILPGWGETRATFRHLIHILEDYYTVYIVDYPGFGNSPFPSRDLSIYDYTNLIMDFIHINQIVDPIVIGHSFGGRIAIVMNGYFHHKISKLVLIGSAGIKPKKTFRQRIRQWSYKFLKKLSCLLPVKKRKSYLKALLHHFGSSDYQKLSANQRKTFIQVINEDLTPYLCEMQADTLLLWGELDQDTPLKDGKKMEQLIPESALVVLKNCTHFCYLEQPILTQNIILEFLKEE